MFIEHLNKEAFLFFFLLVLVLPLLYEVLWLGDEENGGGHINCQLPPHLARAPIHCSLVDDNFSLTENMLTGTSLDVSMCRDIITVAFAPIHIHCRLVDDNFIWMRKDLFSVKLCCQRCHEAWVVGTLRHMID